MKYTILLKITFINYDILLWDKEVPVHHHTMLTILREDSHPVLTLPTAKRGGGGKDTPFENCAKKRRVGTTNANLYAPFCMVVTSATTPLAIGRVTDEYGKQNLRPSRSS